MDGSNYFGDSNMGNERVSGSSSRKGKKNNQDKPKQPQRGLGVAQLEKIRLHGEMGYGFHPPLHNPHPSNFINVSFLNSLFFCSNQTTLPIFIFLIFFFLYFDYKK